MTRKHDQFISDTNTDYLNTRIKELEATIDKLREAIKGLGQFDVTGYCHMCDEYKMHNEECPHTVSALAAGGGK